VSLSFNLKELDMATIVDRVGEMLKQLSPLDQRVEALVSQLTLREKVALLSGLDIWRTVPIERLGIHFARGLVGETIAVQGLAHVHLFRVAQGADRFADRARRGRWAAAIGWRAWRKA
jgi:hypothetical protein